MKLETLPTSQYSEKVYFTPLLDIAEL